MKSSFLGTRLIFLTFKCDLKYLASRIFCFTYYSILLKHTFESPSLRLTKQYFIRFILVLLCWRCGFEQSNEYFHSVFCYMLCIRNPVKDILLKDHYRKNLQNDILSDSYFVIILIIWHICVFFFQDKCFKWSFDSIAPTWRETKPVNIFLNP